MGYDFSGRMWFRVLHGGGAGQGLVQEVLRVQLRARGQRVGSPSLCARPAMFHVFCLISVQPRSLLHSVTMATTCQQALSLPGLRHSNASRHLNMKSEHLAYTKNEVFMWYNYPCIKWMHNEEILSCPRFEDYLWNSMWQSKRQTKTVSDYNLGPCQLS
jgi:hypothetical protein